jgi:hypothetical protein
MMHARSSIIQTILSLLEALPAPFWRRLGNLWARPRLPQSIAGCLGSCSTVAWWLTSVDWLEPPRTSLTKRCGALASVFAAAVKVTEPQQYLKASC